MPTRNRRRFVAQAIRYFLRQDYASRELIIIDDGEDAIRGLIPTDERIRYLQLAQRTSLGAKRTLACREARGDFIAHWDDDDWMAPDRLNLQVTALRKAGADVCGARELLYYHLQAGQAWLYRSPSGVKPWLASGTLLYHRRVWEAYSSAETKWMETAGFIRALEGVRVLLMPDSSFYVGLLHTENTTARNLKSPGWERLTIDEATKRLGQDREFYVKLRTHQPAHTTDLRDAYSVSCIMPTCNRRLFVPQAIQYFMQQDFRRRELVIVDDGSEPILDLIPKREDINYIKLTKRVSTGEKRNIACEASKGDIIIFWDDDDWYSSKRISYQVLPLLKGRSDITGLDKSLILSLGSNKFWACTPELHNRMFPKGIIPGTLAFWKNLWEHKAHFPDLSIAEDAHFLLALTQRGSRVERLPNHGVFVYVRHNNNTWKFSPGKYVDEAQWQEVQTPNWMPAQDLKFYTLPQHVALREKTPQSHHIAKLKPPAVSALAAFPNNDKAIVSACLLSYKRPRNLQPIVDSLHSYDFIDEILVWNNNTGTKLTLSGSKVRILNSKENLICLGRFECAKQAKNQIIYVQDDDVIVQNVPELYRRFLSDPSRITHALSDLHYARKDRYVYSEAHHAFLGWGAFFRKDWLSTLEVHRKTWDDLIFRRGADKFFTMLLQRRHNTLRAQIQTLPYSTSSGIAMYREPNHRFLEALASRRAIASIREAKSVKFPVTWNVVIVCHNYGNYLREAVHSVLANDADYVITIVDDASTDDTAKICSELKHKYSWIHSIRHDHNVEVSRARNSGVAAVDSLFVVLLDADDKIGTDYLFEAEKLLRSGCDVANPDAILFGNQSGRWQVPDVVTLRMLLERNSVHCSAAFRRNYWAQVSGLDESMENWQDYDFWIRLAAGGARIRRLPGDHYFYRKHGESKSTESERKHPQLVARLRQKHQDLYSHFGAGKELRLRS
jgi:glycosyltransferase involved in cell wall biosynthesis